MNRLKLSLELSGYGYFNARQLTDKMPPHHSSGYIPYVEEQRWKIFNFMMLNNEKYSSFIGNQRFDRWDSIPILTKEVLKNDLHGWITKSFEQSKLFHNYTSGSSSGQPFHIYKDKQCHGITWCEIIKMYSDLAGIEIGKDVYGRFMGIAPNSRTINTTIKDWFANRITYNTFHLGKNLFDAATRDIQTRKIKYLYGYAASIAGYARYLENNPAEAQKVQEKLLAVIVTSEMCRDADFQLIRHVFKVPVYNEYGCSEFGVLGVGNDPNMLEIRGRHLWIEVVDDHGKLLPDGTPGRILVTSLFNHAFPFIRFDIGDIGAIRTRENRRFITGLQGRSNEQFKLADGTLISVLSIEFAIDQIYECCPALMEYQLVFFSPDRCEFRYVSTQSSNDDINIKIGSILHEFMGKDQIIEIIQVDSIPKGAAGKTKNILKLY